MKTGRNLQEVLVELNRQNQAKQDFISPAQGMHLREDGHTFEINHLTTNQQEVFGTTSLFHRQVASALGIPAKYYDLMQKEKPELLAENVNSWFADKPSSYMVRSMDYGAGQVARALLSERYRRIDNMEIATAVLPLFAGNDQYEVMSCEVTENRLYLKVVNHRLEMEVRRGDIVQAGVMISNSEVGLGAVSIQPLVYRLVCTNGMVVNDMGERRHHVGRQATPKQYEVWFAELGDHSGTSVQSGTRPVLVISNDVANRNSPVITVIPLSSKLKKLELPVHIVLTEKECEMLRDEHLEDSILLVEQITTIDKMVLFNRLCYVVSVQKKYEIEAAVTKQFAMRASTHGANSTRKEV